MSESTPTVTGLRVQDEGVTVVNPATTMDFVGAGVDATNPSPGKATVTINGGGASGTIVTNEVPTDNADGTYTLAHTPIAGTLVIFKNGSRLNPGAGNDYTQSGTTITLLIAYEAGAVILADYQY